MQKSRNKPHYRSSSERQGESHWARLNKSTEPMFSAGQHLSKKEELGVRDLNFLISHHQNILKHIISRKRAKINGNLENFNSP